MNKSIFTIVFLFIASLGFSQVNRPGDPIPGIGITVEQSPPSILILNTDNNPLIDSINELKTAYYDAVTRKLNAEFKAQLKSSKFTTEEEAYKLYISLLKAKINEANMMMPVRKEKNVVRKVERN